MLAIVIPYYNMQFFEETLQSLSSQSDQRFRVYIGNDASPDNPEFLIELKIPKYLFSVVNIKAVKVRLFFFNVSFFNYELIILYAEDGMYLRNSVATKTDITGSATTKKQSVLGKLLLARLYELLFAINFNYIANFHISPDYQK